MNVIEIGKLRKRMEKPKEEEELFMYQYEQQQPPKTNLAFIAFSPGKWGCFG